MPLRPRPHCDIPSRALSALVTATVALACSNVAVGQDLAWRTTGHDAQRTGQAEGPGPIVPERAWELDTTPLGFSYGHVIDSGGTVYSSYTSELVARGADGNTLWRFTASLLFGAPLLSADESTIFIGGRDASMYALGVSDGSVRWRYPGLSQWVEPMAEATDGTIYGIEATQAVALNPDGSEAWRHVAGATISRITLSADGDLILSTSDGVRSVSPTGTLNWDRPRSTWGNDGAVKSVVGAPDGSIVVCSDFDVHKWTASGTDVFRVRHRCQQAAVASDGTIAAGSHAVSTFTPDGALRWTVNVEGNTGASAGLVYDSGGVLYVGSGESSVRAFDSDGQPRWSISIPHEARSLALGPERRIVVGTYDGSTQASALVSIAEAASPALLVSDRRVVSFREVPAGGSASEVIVLANAGTALLTITAVDLVGLDSGSFRLTSGSPQSLGAGQEVTFSVSYSPAEARAHSAELVLATDGFAGERRIELIGDSAPVGLAESGWPHPAAGPRLTGRSTARAPGLDASVQWEACFSASDAFMTNTRPVVGPGGNVFIGYSGHTVAVSRSGQELWRRRPGSQQTAVRSDGVVLFSSDALRAFSPLGNHLWTFFGDGISNTDGPAVVGPDGTIYYVSVGFTTRANTTLHALDRSGRQLWKVLIGATGNAMDVGLTSAGDIVVGGSLGVWLVDSQGAIQWTRALEGMEPAIGPGDVIYVAHNGGLDALDPDTGETIWNNPDATRSPVSVASDGTIVAGSGIYNADGTLRFSGLPGNSGVAISADDVILLNRNATVFAYDLSGGQLWSVSASKIAANPPVVGEDGLVYVAGNGCLYAIGGQAEAPAIAIDPPAIDFGSVVTGGEVQHVVTVNNVGLADLTVSSLEFIGTDAGHFEIVTQTAPFDVVPFSFAEVTVVFSPTTPGEKTATLAVAHNAPGSPSTVPLVGSGVAASVQVPLVPEISLATAAPGEEFTVGVRIGDATAVPADLFGIGFKLLHNPPLEFVGAEPGPLLSLADPNRFTFFSQESVGSVSVAASRNQPEAGVTDTGVVAIVRFRVPQDALEGPILFTFQDVLAVDSQGREISVLAEEGLIGITGDPPVSEEVLLVPADPVAGENFGWSMYEHAGRLIVGAPDPGSAPVSTGRAVVFEAGTPGVLDPLYVVTPSDGVAGDDFGTAVAWLDNVFLVGARDHDAGGVDEGAVYVYRDEGATYTELQKLLPPDPSRSDAFGREIDVDAENGRLVIGGHYWNSATGANPGAAYVYRVEGEGLVLEATLTESVLPADFYGAAVAISGDYAFVGAYRINNQQGRVWVYRRDAGGAWSLHQQLGASDASDLARFGVAVGVRGTTAVVGAHIEGADFPGAAYVFELIDGTWIETQKLRAPDAEDGEWFGNPVAVSASRVLISALRESDGAISQGGAVYVFEKVGDAWTGTQKIMPSERASLDWFGNGLHVNGRETRLYAGATRHNVGSAADAGAVYQFSLKTTVPVELTLWPGDTDGSGDVSEDDLFPVANCFGLSGPQRAGEFDISWNPVTVSPWGSTLEGCVPATTVDPVLADATGDGTVNHEDVLPIGVNFGLVTAESAGSGSGPQPATKARMVTARTTLSIALLLSGRRPNLRGLSVQLRLPEGAVPVAAGPGSALASQSLDLWAFDSDRRTVHAAASLIQPETVQDPAGELLAVSVESAVPVEASDTEIIAVVLNTASGPVTISRSAVSVSAARSVSSGDREILPERLELSVAPNPVRLNAFLRVELPAEGEMRIALFDVLGREVREIVSDRLSAGRYRFQLDSGGLAAGVYFVRAELDGSSLTRSLVIAR
jgi:WD40 repeat protein